MKHVYLSFLAFDKQGKEETLSGTISGFTLNNQHLAPEGCVMQIQCSYVSECSGGRDTGPVVNVLDRGIEGFLSRQTKGVFFLKKGF